MESQFPPLPRPKFSKKRVRSREDVPGAVAECLRGAGIPNGLIGYEYRPLDEAEWLGEVAGRRLVAIGISGLVGRISIDSASGEIVHTPSPDRGPVTHVNRDLGAFTACVSVAIEQFPFYGEGDDEDAFLKAAQDVKKAILEVDNTSFESDGFWSNFCDDIAMGDYDVWDYPD